MAIDYMEMMTSGSNNDNDFYVYLGNDGNTNFELVNSQSAGIYYIDTQQQDVSYDIYLINKHGDLVGYTNTNRVTATDAFTHVVVIGGVADDVISFVGKATSFTTSKTNINDGAPAFITSVSVSDLESYNDTTVVTGGNFATDVEVYFVGTNAADLAAKSIVRNSSTELVVARPDSLVPDYAPYDVKIINPGIPLPSTAPTQHILPDVITAGEYPIWVTTSPLFWESGETASLTLLAADNELSDIDYEIIAGELWPGFAFDQETGVITGDDSALNTGDLMTFTVRATDTAGNVTEDRAFEIYLNSVPVHSYYFDPFVTAGALEQTLLFDMNIY